MEGTYPPQNGTKERETPSDPLDASALIDAKLDHERKKGHARPILTLMDSEDTDNPAVSGGALEDSSHRHTGSQMPKKPRSRQETAGSSDSRPIASDPLDAYRNSYRC